jgi:hypothetical protein
VEDAQVTPLRIGGNQRLYADSRPDDMEAGLADRGLAFPGPPPVPDKPKPQGEPHGKKRRKTPPPPPQKPAAERKAERQEWLSTVMELIGVTVLTLGVALFSVRVALIVLGACILLPPTLGVVVNAVVTLRKPR